jgi:hypothetical protein
LANTRKKGKIKYDENQEGEETHGNQNLFGPQLRDYILPDYGPDSFKKGHMDLLPPYSTHL